jgi:hypothetical protein
MPEEQRKRLRDMRLSAAARGLRVPDPSVPPGELSVARCGDRAGIIRLVRMKLRLCAFAWALWSNASSILRVWRTIDALVVTYKRTMLLAFLSC